jgi:hypothetical protein
MQIKRVPKAFFLFALPIHWGAHPGRQEINMELSDDRILTFSASGMTLLLGI